MELPLLIAGKLGQAFVAAPDQLVESGVDVAMLARRAGPSSIPGLSAAGSCLHMPCDSETRNMS